MLPHQLTQNYSNHSYKTEHYSTSTVLHLHSSEQVLLENLLDEQTFTVYITHTSLLSAFWISPAINTQLKLIWTNSPTKLCCFVRAMYVFVCFSQISGNHWWMHKSLVSHSLPSPSNRVFPKTIVDVRMAQKQGSEVVEGQSASPLISSNPSCVLG